MIIRLWETAHPPLSEANMIRTGYKTGFFTKIISRKFDHQERVIVLFSLGLTQGIVDKNETGCPIDFGLPGLPLFTVD